jgi:RNA polymerase I-specific transcription initiation factor RRN6
MIHSRTNNLVQVYSFIGRSPGLVTCSDPTLLDLSIPGLGHLTNVFIEKMEHEDFGSEAQFFQLFVTLSDLSVFELVVRTLVSTADDPIKDDQALESFTRSTISRPRNPTSRSRAVNKDDEFVSPDGLATAESPRSKVVTPRPHWYDTLNDPAAYEARDNSILGEVMLRPKSAAEESGAIDAVTVMDQVNEMLATGADLPSMPLGTL